MPPATSRVPPCAVRQEERRAVVHQVTHDELPKSNIHRVVNRGEWCPANSCSQTLSAEERAMRKRSLPVLVLLLRVAHMSAETRDVVVYAPDVVGVDR